MKLNSLGVWKWEEKWVVKRKRDRCRGMERNVEESKKLRFRMREGGSDTSST